MGVGVEVGVIVDVGVEVTSTQSNTASKLKILHESVLLGVGVGQFAAYKDESKSGQRLVLPTDPCIIQAPPSVSERHH